MIVRLLDRLISRNDASRQGYWEGMASSAAVLTSTFNMPDREAILPQLVSMTQQAYGSNPIVFAAIATRIMLFSEAVFAYQTLDDKRLIDIRDRRKRMNLSLLEEPWPGASTAELLCRMLQDVDLAGNAYIWNAGDRLVRLRPDWVTVVSGLAEEVNENGDTLGPPWGRQYRKVLGYFEDPPPGSEPGRHAQWYDPEQVAHWMPTPDPTAAFRGMSWLTPVIREINADLSMTDYKNAYLENAASPNMVIKYDQVLRPDTIDAIRERLQARYGGVSNAFKTLVLDRGADFQVVGNSPEQMSFTDIQQAGETRILAASGVPGLLVGTKDGAYAQDYQSSMRRFADLVMRPLWRSVCASLANIVPVPAHDVRLWYDVADIQALQQGEMERAQTSLVQAQALKMLVDSGFTKESAQQAVSATDVRMLKAAPMPEPVENRQPVQHLLPQQQPGATAKPLPSAGGRLPVGSTSPGDGGNNTRPTPTPQGARRGHGWGADE